MPSLKPHTNRLAQEKKLFNKLRNGQLLNMPTLCMKNIAQPPQQQINIIMLTDLIELNINSKTTRNKWQLKAIRMRGTPFNA